MSSVFDCTLPKRNVTLTAFFSISGGQYSRTIKNRCFDAHCNVLVRKRYFFFATCRKCRCRFCACPRLPYCESVFLSNIHPLLRIREIQCRRSSEPNRRLTPVPLYLPYTFDAFYTTPNREPTFLSTTTTVSFFLGRKHRRRVSRKIHGMTSRAQKSCRASHGSAPVFTQTHTRPEQDAKSEHQICGGTARVFFSSFSSDTF